MGLGRWLRRPRDYGYPMSKVMQAELERRLVSLLAGSPERYGPLIESSDSVELDRLKEAANRMTDPPTFDLFCDRCGRPIRGHHHIPTLCTWCGQAQEAHS